jgi:hypothetical protein
MRHPFTTAFRPFLRQSAGRRFASTNTEGAQKKAQDALGSVQKNAEKAWETTKKALGPAGEKAGNMLGCKCRSFKITSCRRYLGLCFLGLDFILVSLVSDLFPCSLPQTPDVQPFRNPRTPQTGLHS